MAKRKRRKKSREEPGGGGHVGEEFMSSFSLLLDSSGRPGGMVLQAGTTWGRGVCVGGVPAEALCNF